MNKDNNGIGRCGKMIRFAFYFTCISVMTTIHASAYIDPATTSYIIQIAAGIVIACGTAIGIFWNKLKRKFKKKEDTVSAVNLKSRGDEQGGVVTADDLLDDTDK